MKKIVLIAAFALGTYLVSAQAPEKMSYQAIMRNASGQLLANQNVAVRVSVLQSSAAGTAVYSERITGTTNVNGLVSLEIGSGTVLSGTFNTINWGGNSYYLKTETDPTGGTNYTITGTSQLLSVPYALYAKSAGGGGGSFTLPYTNTLTNASDLFTLANNGDGSSIVGQNSTTTSSISAIRGEITNTAPGGFSSAVKGINNGTGGLGIGVWGSQAGSGWGVYGSTPNGLGVYGNSSANGTGVYANSNAGIGLQATSSNGIPASLSITNNTNPNNVINSSTLGDGAAFEGISSSTTSSIAVIRGIVDTTAPGGFSSAVRGINNGTGGLGIGVWGSQAGSGWGVYGVTPSGIGVYGNSSASGYGVYANSTSGTGLQATSNNGIAANISIMNNANANNVLEISTVGNGKGVNVNVSGSNHGVYSVSTGGTGIEGMTSSISSAGVIGRNSTGEAIVGFSSGAAGVGAVVGRADGAGYGVRGFNTNTGIGVLGQSGISGGTGKAARFENVNSSNTANVLEVSSNSTANLAVFQKNGSNIARIDQAGKGFFNGGTQTGGADIAEAFDVKGLTSDYEPGDILVISASNDRSVEKSSRSYSNLVAGVYATKPGVLLTEENVDSELIGKVPMGVIGVIPTKVCLEGGSIKRGDLLVTSSISGVAMKANLKKVKIGQVLGKALQDYNQNSIGKIQVLVSIK